MATQTPNLGLYKPEQADTVGATIGTHLPANFDIIDNLAAQPNSYASGVSGFTPDSIKAALDALAGVRIVEMGSNANGEYVRWENGLQACWADINYGPVDITTVVGSIYRAAFLTWTYPAAFIQRPAFAPQIYDSTLLWPGSVALGGYYSGGAAFYVMSATSGSQMSIRAGLLAIGRWK